MHTYKILQTAPLLAYLLRAMVRRIDRKALPRERARNLETEVTENLLPLVIAARSTMQFVRNFALRYNIALAGGTFTGGDGVDHTAAPVYFVIPRVLVQHAGLTEMQHDRVKNTPEQVVVRWDVAALVADFQAVRIHINDNPAFWATFAFADDDPSDLALFEVPDMAARDVAPFVAPLPEHTVTPRSFRTVWTLADNFSHGADADTGNFSTFRRERAIDPTTGAQHLVPIVAGNAIRGMLRDLAASNLCEALGIESTDLPPLVSHALFSGGTLEQGADGGFVDLGLRRRLRAMLPLWDVFGGVWAKKQICPGILMMHDAVVVCAENAWRVYHHLVPKAERAALPIDQFRASLLRADDLTQLRQGTRHAHREFDDANGYQMLWQDEILMPGTRLVHSFQIRSIVGVSSLSRSFVTALLESFHAYALAGAGNARGFGGIAFDPYVPAGDEKPLPSADEYHAWLRDHGDEIRELLMGSTTPAAAAAPAKKTPRGRSRSGEAGA